MNGGPDCDLWEDLSLAGGEEKLEALRMELVSHGVTAFLPTLITAPMAHLVGNINVLKKHINRHKENPGNLERNHARMIGIHLEGPFLSPERPGVHPADCIQPFTAELARQLLDPAVAMVTAACEGDHDGKAIALLQENNIVVALGHSNATFDEANRAFSQGVAIMTHTFNALPPLHHRNLGAVGAALLSPQTTCCLIADGLHLDKAACALIFALKGSARTILVTDRAYIGTSSGDLVGSSISLEQAVQNMVKWNICTFAEAITMATLNPARVVGVEQHLGEISPGKIADLVFFDRESLAVERVMLGGKEVMNKKKAISSRG
jgi:N-acetylglucosamine-6-phosphate deacetylase